MGLISNFSDARDGNQSSAEIHYLPFQIDHNGKADVKIRFVDTIQTNPDNDKVKETQFRGRPLKGADVDVPEGYKGVIARLTSPQEDEKENVKDQKFVIEKDFEKFVNWNWDKVPSAMDGPVKVLDWLRLASSLHSPEDGNET